MTSLHDVALLRLAAQRLVGPGCASAVESVRWLTAMQAQDRAGALLSVALRTEACTRADVEAAMDAGQVVKSWPMRGTLHLVAAEDLPWMLHILAPRVVSGSRKRREGLGLTDQTLERAGDVAVEVLSTTGPLSRSSLRAAWEDAGVSTAGQRGAHILGYLAMTGTVVFGPTREGEHLLTLLDTWIPHPRELERDEALGELAARYFRSHGPATVLDLARWAYLVSADARAGVAVARAQLTSLDIDGVEHLMDPLTPDWLRAARSQAEGVLLLPGYDEFMLGYSDRRAQLDPAFFQRIVPGGNGVFRRTVLSSGRVVGTWNQRGRGTNPTVEATPFTSFTPEESNAIAYQYPLLP